MESYEPDGIGATARAVLLRDVTDRQTREQRLAVLNRVLRHNVRNELDVILAHADHIDDEERRTPIRESASALVELSNKAREAEEIMDASADSRTDRPRVGGGVTVPRRMDIILIPPARLSGVWIQQYQYSWSFPADQR